MIVQCRGRPQGNGDKTDLRLFSKKNMIFQGRGRPQGTGDKTPPRLCPKKKNDFSIPAGLLLFGLLAPGCFFGFWPPAVSKFLAPGCIKNFGLRLFWQYFGPAVFQASL